MLDFLVNAGLVLALLVAVAAALVALTLTPPRRRGRRLRRRHASLRPVHPGRARAPGARHRRAA